jgi:DNA helicase-2/ATP-dependent DNA helicase PcrA
MNNDVFDSEYKRLNREQKLAVDTIDGPVMVNAGPGTGKTQILTLRIGNILKNTDTQPENILALTFTNSGVYAMRERLRSYIGDPAYRVNIFTFHAFSEHVIKTFPLYFEKFEYAHVIDDVQKVRF